MRLCSFYKTLFPNYKLEYFPNDINYGVNKKKPLLPTHDARGASKPLACRRQLKIGCVIC